MFNVVSVKMVVVKETRELESLMDLMSKIRPYISRVCSEFNWSKLRKSRGASRPHVQMTTSATPANPPLPNHEGRQRW